MHWLTTGKAGESVLVTGAKGKPPTSDYKVSYILQLGQIKKVCFG